MAVSTTLAVRLEAIESASADLAAATATHQLISTLSLATGTGAGQADRVWSDERTLTTGANEDLDLADSLASVIGTTFAPARLKAIAILAASANTTNLTLSRPASNGVPFFAAASDAVVLHPGSIFVATWPGATAIVVTASTGDLINIANAAGASATYKIVLIGASA